MKYIKDFDNLYIYRNYIFIRSANNLFLVTYLIINYKIIIHDISIIQSLLIWFWHQHRKEKKRFLSPHKNKKKLYKRFLVLKGEIPQLTGSHQTTRCSGRGCKLWGLSSLANWRLNSSAYKESPPILERFKFLYCRYQYLNVDPYYQLCNLKTNWDMSMWTYTRDCWDERKEGEL